MRRIADLHTHSTASDGQYPPGELVELARRRGIEVLALTDHDTTDGLTEAEPAGERLGVRIVRGVELSAREYPTFHILGYRFRRGETPLSALCARMRQERENRKQRIIDFLRGQGVDIPLSEVEALSKGVNGRPHFAQVIVRHGYAATNKEVFDRWLDTPDYHRQVERGKPPVRTCLDAIRESGGVSALAHPYQIGLDDDALDALVRELRDAGLDAIECYYPRYTPEQQAFYLRLAEKYGLRITGGSDFHGERVKPDIALAAWELETDWLLTE